MSPTVLQSLGGEGAHRAVLCRLALCTTKFSRVRTPSFPEYGQGEYTLRAQTMELSRYGWDGVEDTFLVCKLRHGAHLLTDQGERERMAVLLLRAGERRLTKSSAFQNAASHLNLEGSGMLNRH
jgi:hypothetical protein